MILPVVLLLGCRTSVPVSPSQDIYRILVKESFDDLATTAKHWTSDDLARIPDAKLQLVRDNDNDCISLMLPSATKAREFSLHRSIDLTAVRGQRLRLSARVRTPKSGDAAAHVRLSISPTSAESTYSDFVDSRSFSSDSWSDAYAVVDVDRLATRGDIALTVTGTGAAWFDDIRLVSLGPTPSPQVSRLSSFLNERLATLARALALVRYFHPSDQVAAVDWDRFSVAAIDRVLSSPSTMPLPEVLTRIFLPIAPSVRFVAPGTSPRTAEVKDSRATRLVRWHHVGLGSDTSNTIYHSFRDGIDGDETATTYVYSPAQFTHLGTCQSGEIQATVHGASGMIWLYVRMYQGSNHITSIQQVIKPESGRQVVTSHGNVPADTQLVQLGFYLQGRSSVRFSDVNFRCQNGEAAGVVASSTWSFEHDQDLFRKAVIGCETVSCLSVGRVEPDTEFRSERDHFETDIGGGTHVVLPLAVWSDGATTFPRLPPVELPAPDHAIADVAVRLAAVVTTWGALSWFYPYFADQRIDWSGALTHGLDEVAMSGSPAQTHRVLAHMIAELQDGHARVRHPTHSMLGMLPLALRKFDDKIIIIGTLPEYATLMPPGSELLSIDGASASTLYSDSYAAISAATPRFRDYLTSLYISLGAIGSLRHVAYRRPDGTTLATLLPLVSRQIFDKDVQRRRPQSGTEIAPSIIYISPEELGGGAAPTLVQSLQSARAVILDLRGYFSDDVFNLLSHFISHPIPSPEFRAPIVSPTSRGGYEDESWLLWPTAPSLNCRMFVLLDTRAVSAVETALQIIHDNHLATLIGEASAGTNGNVNTFSVPGGFEVRFTGLRTSAPDGSTVQGRGITPDQVVHPSLEGIRAGRDEILEAAIAAAQRP
jgi:hypothetical protein